MPTAERYYEIHEHLLGAITQIADEGRAGRAVLLANRLALIIYNLENRIEALEARVGSTESLPSNRLK